MSIYGQCISGDKREATHAVVHKAGVFMPANDRFADDRMSVAFNDIVFCEGCAEEFAARANGDDDAGGSRCDLCEGPARFRVEGNAAGTKCVGHVQQYLREPTAVFYSVEPLDPAHA